MTETGLNETGPIDYLIVEYPAGHEPDGSAFPYLLDLVQRGVISVLDLAFVHKGADGSVTGIDISAAGFGADFELFADASSGLLDAEDFAEAGAALEPGCTAAIIVYENVWAGPFAAALRRTGAQLVASGRIPVQAILATLDAADAV